MTTNNDHSGAASGSPQKGPQVFRTPTGQTGLDAYVYEAAQIANAQRELDSRMSRLLTVVHEEAPELFEYSSDFCPACGDGVGTNAAGFIEYLRDGRTR